MLSQLNFGDNKQFVYLFLSNKNTTFYMWFLPTFRYLIHMQKNLEIKTLSAIQLFTKFSIFLFITAYLEIYEQALK